jgi:DNA-binding CsgD family transcriptional regulator
MEAAIADARGGRARALVIRGEAGIGKTALLDYARECAQGMTALSARGIQSESDLPHSALVALLGPVLDLRSELPEVQRRALEGALALGPPTPADRLALAVATLALVGAAAERRPLLIAVDDFQWVDDSSAEVVLFVARRLEGERAAALLTVRDGEGVRPLEGIEELELRGLEEAAARELLARAAPSALPPEVVERLLAAAGGNPLALLEIPAALDESQLCGRTPLDEPLSAGSRLQAALRRRFDALPEPSRRALVVAATSRGESLQVVAGACARLGLEATALEAAEDAGLATLAGEELRFRHPLVRSGAYHAASPSDRRAAHRALAAVEPSRIARGWHLAAAAIGADEEAARALEEAAGEAAARGGLDAAAAALERAAALSPEQADRARRLVASAATYSQAGPAERAAELLREALQLPLAPRARAEAEHVLGRVEMLRGSLDEAHRLMLAAGERLAAEDPGSAAMVVAEAGVPCFMAGRIASAVATERRALELAEPAGGVSLDFARVLLVGARSLAGEIAAAEAEGLGDRVVELLAHARTAPAPLVISPIPFLTWWEEFGAAAAYCERLLDAAREAGMAGALPLLLAGRAELDFRLGDWRGARAHGAESVRLAEEAGQLVQTPFPLVNLARVEAAMGLEELAREHVQRALETAALAGMASIPVYAGSYLGLLELGAGRMEEAARQLDAVAARCDELGMHDPSTVQWRADHVEALVRVGRPEEAEASLAVLRAQAERTGRTWARAAAARCAALLAPDEDLDAAFEDALELHDPQRDPFELARTELAYGERLRRAGRRHDAREPLRRALSGFERLEAAPWARRTRSELRASGAAVGPVRDVTTRELTPQEMEVALVVARGATNREAAASLFLSPKTVEAHLGRVYRKLGVRSRTELAGRMLAAEPAGGERLSA